MKVKIKDLKPNPFRDMKNYPINQEKIQSLTNSINETGFWDNILARKNNGNIEIAYGHHRLVVLKKLFKCAIEGSTSKFLTYSAITFFSLRTIILYRIGGSSWSFKL